MTVILGGGISGLTAAYYAANHSQIASVTLFEASKRLGGWICSKKSPNGAIFEQGPRTIRPHGLAGKNTLQLIEDIGLIDKLIHIRSNHPAAQNRLIYSNKALHLLPTSLKSIFKTTSLLNRPLINTVWTDLSTPKMLKDDESIYSFTERRLGQDIARYLISPLICGICAGDAHKISVNFLFKSLFEAEQKYGSITKGVLMKQVKNFFTKFSTKDDIDNKSAELNQNLVQKAQKEKWSLWSLQGGLEQLPLALTDILQKKGVKIQTEKKCERIVFKSDHVELLVDGNIQECSRVISSLSAKDLAKLLKEEHPLLTAELEAIPTVTVAVVNLEFQGDVLPMQAFGFLIPPNENLPLLGVIFDSCIFSQRSSTVLTVMMGGAWFEKYFGLNPTDEQLLMTAINQVKEILYINEEPIARNVAILRNCIPQHVVGHVRRVKRIQDYITAHEIPLGLCGSSYQGVGLNDVILSAKQAVHDIVK